MDYLAVAVRTERRLGGGPMPNGRRAAVRDRLRQPAQKTTRGWVRDVAAGALGRRLPRPGQGNEQYEELCKLVNTVLAAGLRLSPFKTKIINVAEGVDIYRLGVR